jgi:3(or 17)beta-hydroxysteroid dehydrogenase
MADSLTGHVAIVTGGAEGIGAAIVARLAGRGVRVVVADVKKSTVSVENAIDHHCDVGSEADWDQLGSFVGSRFGRLDYLVCNAGINLGRGGLADTSYSTWRKHMNVNLDGAFFGCRLALRMMRESGGAIVIVSSATAVRPAPDYPSYSVSKAAIGSLNRLAALEGAKARVPIRCNAVLPGSVETPLTDRLRSQGGDTAAAKARQAARHPLGFVGRPDDIAAAVDYLLSDEARFVTGAELVVDGGLSIAPGQASPKP